jgi:hypothetical protein
LLFASSLWALIGGCSAASQKRAGGVAVDAPPCRSPEQAGCAECCEQQYGPNADDLICNRRTAANPGQKEKGHDYAEQAASLEQGACPATCRQCAACTSDREASYHRLLSRGCDCLDPFVRDVVRGLDPCFTDGCGCTCSLLSALSACGPPT